METKNELPMNVNDANDEDLGQVNGGATELWTTDMQCSRCGYEDKWSGNYEGSIFYCPKCGQFSYKGIKSKCLRPRY